ncbi:Tat pathway signal protein [Streptomyces sp. NPDC050448]|uniref:Tat pathway signal protein n=1 Tax=Streptomyces sp. NPDC050448 TaxID=3155404 RepID=UPI00341449CE
MLACAALTGGLLQATPVLASPQQDRGAPGVLPVPASGGVEDAGKKLGKDWKSSPDRAVTAAADSAGLHLLVADGSTAYAWKTAAVLSEPGLPADSWIGNQCVMDHDHAAVVYAPRAFVNKPDLMQGGAFTAVVNLVSGEVTKLEFTASLAYFDPSCNSTTHTAAFTAFRDMNDPALTRTRVLTVDTQGRTTSSAAAPGEITSAVPVKDGTVAALGRRLVHLDRSGKVKDLATADSTPFDIRPAADGSVAFVDRTNASTLRAKVFTGRGAPTVIASGKLGDLDLMQGEAGRVFLTGHPTGTPATKGTGITRIDAPSDRDVSSHGRLAIDPVLTAGIRASLERVKDAGKGFTTAEPSPEAARSSPDTTGTPPVTVTSTATTTGARLTQTMQHHAAGDAGAKASPVLRAAKAASAKDSASASGKASSPFGTAAAPPLVAAPATAPVPGNATDDDRWCAVSRNDVGAQALQPTPNQVEWAVDMAVRGNLRANYLRQGGYRDQAGLGTIDPQGLFPKPTLTGDGRIPANVLLGIMAQESNLWQAESGAIPGQMGNPLAAVDGYYGHKASPNDPAAYWHINWEKSDCGYGVGQVTDGMRIAGHEKVDANGNKEKLLSPALQKLVAIDYASNVAASLKILADKWNEVHTDGQKVTVNNDNPAMVENWFTAVWNYNLGFNPPSEAAANGGHWGLGWYNNPANPLYKKSWGHPFMNTDVDGAEANRDAEHPQDWPYQSKVMGWAAWSIDTGFSYATSGRQDWRGESGFSSAGFRPAWWNTKNDRIDIQPPLETFCNTNNNCDPATPPNCSNEECYRQFWWNQPNVSWKASCNDTCGHEALKYETLVNEPGRGYRLKNGTPVCSGAPAGALVVASVPDGTPSWGDCGTISSAGSFQFAFNPGAQNRYEAKADLHRIGGGYGGNFWYAHDRDAKHLGGDNGAMTVFGDWKLGKPVDGGQARVYAHIPDTGATAKEAIYEVITPFTKDPKNPKKTVKKVDQGANAGKWVDLGAYRFNNELPEVALSNANSSGAADKDIAWDAIAFVPGKFTGVDITLTEVDKDAPNVDWASINGPVAMTPPSAQEFVPAVGGAQAPRSGPASSGASGAPRATPGATKDACGTPDAHGVRGCLRMMPEPVKPDSPVAQKQPAAAGAAADVVPWCVPGTNQFTRFEACMHMQFQYVGQRIYPNKPPEEIGRADFDVNWQIKLNQKSGSFKQQMDVRATRIDTALGGVSLTSRFHCFEPQVDCVDQPAQWQGALNWALGDSHTATATKENAWTNPATGSNGAPARGWDPINFTWAFIGSSPNASTPTLGLRVMDDDALFQCDNFAINNTVGCSFGTYEPTYQFNTKKYPAAAAHAWLVQNVLTPHAGTKANPLHYLPNNKNKWSRDTNDNRQVICPNNWPRHPDVDTLMAPELTETNKDDSRSCDEFAFAGTYESGGMPTAMNGRNQVASGDACLQTVARRVAGVPKLEDDERSSLPTFQEVCGRSSMSGFVNSGSMNRFGGFAEYFRLLDADAYYVSVPGFEHCPTQGPLIQCKMTP